MKFEFLLVLALFLANESNSLGKCYDCPENSRAKCAVCDESPCRCEELIPEDKTTFKKLIHLYLKRANFNNGDQECRHCRNPCSKKQEIVKLLVGILKKACTCEKEEEAIKDIILKLLDPSECRKKPCQPHCDLEVQRVLKTLLKKAVGCNCENCPSNCYEDRPHRGQEEYQYWFKTSRTDLRRDIFDKTAPNRPQQMLEKFQESRNSFQDVNKVTQYNKNKEGYKCECENCRNCITRQRPDGLICPCYISDDSAIRSKADLFSICADCINCHILPHKQTDAVTFLCEDCKHLDSPFVQFTHNGYPFKKVPEITIGRIQIKSNFLQINDFRVKTKKNHPTATERVKEVIYNPFQPKANGPVKKRVRGCGKKKKFKWR